VSPQQRQLAQPSQPSQVVQSLQPISSLASVLHPTQLALGPRRSARIRAQNHTKPTQGLADVKRSRSITQQQQETSNMTLLLRRSPRLRQGLPGHSFATPSSEYSNPKIHELVDAGANCLICIEGLSDPTSVARCNNCGVDCHSICLATWWRNEPTCVQWYEQTTM
jgi:hypothetical protein